jgi:hypothetical protein
MQLFELIPQNEIFYSICALGRRFRREDFGGAGIGVFSEMYFIAELNTSFI